MMNCVLDSMCFCALLLGSRGIIQFQSVISINQAGRERYETIPTKRETRTQRHESMKRKLAISTWDQMK